MMALPNHLRLELTEFLFSDEAGDFAVFFKDCPDEFKYQLVLNMYPRQYKPNEEIISKGTEVSEVFFIVKGSVVLSTRLGLQAFLKLPEKSHFGEDSIIFNTLPQMSFV